MAAMGAAHIHPSSALEKLHLLHAKSYMGGSCSVEGSWHLGPWADGSGATDL